MKLNNTNLLLGIVNTYIIDSPTTTNISYVWNIGSQLGMILVLQIISGITLAFHYTPNITDAFNSIVNIQTDIWYGGIVRYMHSNGAALFFILVYIHIGKAIYYRSYCSPRIGLWNAGIIIYFILMATAFLGYTLPFGSMSYWGGTVITSLFSAIPYIGNNLVILIWGGYSITNATLTRFYALHFVLPFILIGLVIIHLIYLHANGSNNPIGISTNTDKLPFNPYFIFKDIIGFIFILVLYIVLISYLPNQLGDSDNYIPADALVTPASIVPEFYFLAFYAMLRAIPNKLLGVIIMVSAILILFILPYRVININSISNINSNINTKCKSNTNYNTPIAIISYWIFIANFILLTWLGGQHATPTNVILSIIATGYYFIYLILLVIY